MKLIELNKYQLTRIFYVYSSVPSTVWPLKRKTEKFGIIFKTRNFETGNKIMPYYEPSIIIYYECIQIYIQVLVRSNKSLTAKQA